MKRTKLAQRLLPNYTKGEECMNMVSHIVGGALGIAALILCILQAADKENPYGIVSGAIYGGAMLALYAVSSVYHGLRPSMGKKVMQIIDHCTIYILIAGSYTPVVLSAIRPVYPVLGWGLLIFEWALAALAVTLTAIDLKQYRIFSMTCYIGMGWAILPFMKQTMSVLTPAGFGFLLAGGIAYTIGAVLYGIGSKKRWFHSVFHVFVVLGSALQLISILCYAL